MSKSTRITLLFALAALTAAMALEGCDCGSKWRSRPARSVEASVGDDLASRPSAFEPSPREPGPPRPESAEQLDQAEKQARRWTDDLLKGGLARREVASMADIRGYRFFRRRSFGRALRWFSTAASIDPTYEPALFNAARSAALLGDAATARKLLARLQRLRTPLSQRQLNAAARHKDFAVLHRKPPAEVPR